MTIIRTDESRVDATLARHVTTVTPTNSLGGRSIDVDLFRLPDGEMIECVSWESDCRPLPVEVQSGESYWAAADRLGARY